MPYLALLNARIMHQIYTPHVLIYRYFEASSLITKKDLNKTLQYLKRLSHFTSYRVISTTR